MKKLAMLLLCIGIAVMCSGCWIYGEGSTVGYVTTVEDGIFWNTVWIRADVTSSQTNGYAVRKNYQGDELKTLLLKSAEAHQKVELFFKKHVGMARNDDNALSDEIIRFKIIE